ncbi:MAG: hypothetical protein ACHP7N_00120 [Caulobacterales bacterium]
MNRVVFVALGTVLCAGPLALPVSLQADPARSSSYTAPRNSLGQPDLEGAWTNATLTPESRPASLGDRAAYTPEEVAKLEAAVVKEASLGNQPTDPNAPPPSIGGDKLPPGTRPEFAAAGGAVGGYNYGWLDPGSTVMRVHGEPRTSLITTPDGRAPQPKAGAAAGFGRFSYGDFGNFDNPENRSLGERCIMSFGRNAGPPMFANGFYNNDYQIVQSKDSVAILVEMVHDVRVVRLNSTHRMDGVRPWMGDSIGHWEGDTLVVETTNIPRAEAYHGSWKDLKITERFTRVSKDRLLYQFTVEDPTVWDKPWGGEYEFAPLKGRVYEYACHEGNYALEDMLAGARAEEAAAAAKAASATKAVSVR